MEKYPESYVENLLFDYLITAPPFISCNFIVIHFKFQRLFCQAIWKGLKIIRPVLIKATAGNVLLLPENCFPDGNTGDDCDYRKDDVLGHECHDGIGEYAED